MILSRLLTVITVPVGLLVAFPALASPPVNAGGTRSALDATLGPPRLAHPQLTLRDSHGTPVFESGKAVSSQKTCHGCHEVPSVETHRVHASLGMEEVTELGRAPSGRPWDFGTGPFGRWDPMTYAMLSPPGSQDYLTTLQTWMGKVGGRCVGGGPLKQFIEHDCLVCHAREASASDRAHAIEQGKFGKEQNETLVATGLVACACKGGGWNRDAFLPSGELLAEAIGLGQPSDRACGGCHVMVHGARTPLALAGKPRGDRDRLRMTESEGVIWSSQQISHSAINIVGKNGLDRPWDVHAQKGVSCIGCHFAPSAPTPVPHRLDRQARDCEDCHLALPLHKFLPQAPLHFSALGCKSCHIPTVMAPARSETDWTMLAGPGEPRIAYRGIKGSIDDEKALVEGYAPILLPRTLPTGKSQLAPGNLVTSWFWVEDGPMGPRPVPLATLEHAFLLPGKHHPRLVGLMDRNGDGDLAGDELVLDSDAKVAAAKDLLATAGAHKPRIQGEIQPYNLNHGIVSGRFATRACATCHSRNSRLNQDFQLSAHAPASVRPVLVGDAHVYLPGPIVRETSGQLILRMRAAQLSSYLPGAGQFKLADVIGWIILLVTILGLLGRGALRRS